MSVPGDVLQGAQPRAVDAGRGVAWWGEAWQLFRRAPGMWILIVLVLFVAAALVSLVPFLGGLAVSLLLPVVLGGLIMAAHKVDQGQQLAFGDAFVGFREKFEPLLVLGGLTLAASVVIGIVAMIFGVGAFAGMAGGLASGSTGAILAGIGSALVMVLVLLGLGIVLTMALWFAPALVVFRGTPALQAVQLSFAACLRNILPMLVHSLLYLLAAVVATIPLGLGWLVLAPVVLLTMYTSYRDVFAD
jgi:hypothetical protein